MRKVVLVCYDISNNKRRYQLSRFLSQYGDRIQYSVFQVMVAQHQFNSFRAHINAIIEPSCDSINYYFICHWRRDRITRLGQATLLELTGYVLIS